MVKKLEHLECNILRFKDYYPEKQKYLKIIYPKLVGSCGKPLKKDIGVWMFYKNETYHNGSCLDSNE